MAFRLFANATLFNDLKDVSTSKETLCRPGYTLRFDKDRVLVLCVKSYEYVFRWCSREGSWYTEVAFEDYLNALFPDYLKGLTFLATLEQVVQLPERTIGKYWYQNASIIVSARKREEYTNLHCYHISARGGAKYMKEFVLLFMRGEARVHLTDDFSAPEQK